MATLPAIAARVRRLSVACALALLVSDARSEDTPLFHCVVDSRDITISATAQVPSGMTCKVACSWLTKDGSAGETVCRGGVDPKTSVLCTKPNDGSSLQTIAVGHSCAKAEQ